MQKLMPLCVKNLSRARRRSKQQAKPNNFLRNAFTLVEMIFVMAVMAVLFSLAFPLFDKKISSPRVAAEQLASALQLARQYAIEHGTFTRLVFANADLCAATTNKLSHAYGLYVFFVPKSDSTNLSLEYVGQWIPMPLEPEWQYLENVNILFTNGATDENTLKTFYFKPTQTWAMGEMNCFASKYCGCFYPSNFFQTPYPTSYSLTNTSSNTDKFFKISGTPNFYNLRGIEFDSQGKPTYSDTNHLSIRIADPQNTNHYYDVVINRLSGMIQAKSP